MHSIMNALSLKVDNTLKNTKEFEGKLLENLVASNLIIYQSDNLMILQYNMMATNQRMLILLFKKILNLKKLILKIL